MSLPSSFSTLDDAPAGEVAPLMERAAAEGDPETLSRLTDLLLDRSLRLLRDGSREEILDEALAVSGGVSGEAGRLLKERSPETFGAWTALDDLLAEAARRSDQAAVPSLLKSTEGRGMAILELLAGEGRAVPRAEIRRRLSLAEAHLSHLLRDLEEADLIVRHRPQGAREVLVELGPVGRDVVSQSVLPDWLKRLDEASTRIAAGSPLDSAALIQELQEAGAPSELAADCVVKIVVRLAPAAAYRGRPERAEPAAKDDNLHRFLREVSRLPSSEYREIETTEAGLHPGAGFSTPDAA